MLWAAMALLIMQNCIYRYILHFDLILKFTLLLCPRIPTVKVSQDEGLMELEISDDPYDVQRIDVSSAPCVITVNKVSFRIT